MASAAPPPSSVLFARGVVARLAVWSTLRIAVQEGWGGPGAREKRTWLASVIVDAFEETIPSPDDQYIEELLLQVMADEYDVVIEDGSAEDVASDIAMMWEESTGGKQELVLKFEGLADRLKDTKVTAQEVPANGDDESDWDDEDSDEDVDMPDENDEEAPQLLRHPENLASHNEPEVDEDGFTLVKGKGKKTDSSHRTAAT
jgi:pre-rRNA-processing protein TSR2